MKVSFTSNKLACFFWLLTLTLSIGYSAAAQQQLKNKDANLDQAIAYLRKDVEQKLPRWREIFKVLSMDESYDPDLVMGYCLRLGASSMDCRISTISGLLAFERMHGTEAVNEALPKLKTLLLDFQSCEVKRACSDIEDGLKELAGEVEAPPSRLDAIDPERIYNKCLADQNPNDPCAKPLCVSATVFSTNFALLLAMDQPTRSESQTQEQKQRASEIQRLIDRLNKFALKAQRTEANMECKKAVGTVPDIPDTP